MILFKLPSGKSVLHTGRYTLSLPPPLSFPPPLSLCKLYVFVSFPLGDFRASHSITDHALLKATPIDTLFLDTT